MGPITPKRTLGVILGQVAGHAQEPGPRINDILSRLPLLPEAEKCFLGYIHGRISI